METTKEFIIEGKKQEKHPVSEFNPDAKKFTESYKFAEQLFYLIDPTLRVTNEHNDYEFIINVYGDNVSHLIGRNGRGLAVLNFLIGCIAIKNNDCEGWRVVIDIGNYRNKRKDALIDLATKKAKFVSKTGKTVKLRPMLPYERAIIHSAVQNIEGATTISVGKEPNRSLWIQPSAR
ncbi:MAG: hypothetical protein LBH47_03805 [Christensenellaceae bacterium]|jgi:spoIIIJ-associated protein|nr:hypothetical protein [Christensenellaceae bacterium]